VFRVCRSARSVWLRCGNRDGDFSLGDYAGLDQRRGERDGRWRGHPASLVDPFEILGLNLRGNSFWVARSLVD
jgi:hypothetical protein